MVGPTDKFVEVSLSMPFSVLAKRRHDDGVGVSDRKNLKGPSSLRAIREVVGLMSG